MSVIANFTVPALDFALGRVLEVERGLRIQVESMIPTGDAVMPYLWVPSHATGAIAAAIEDTDVARSVTVVDEVGDETLLRVEWGPDVDGLVASALAVDAAILEAVGTGDDWSFQLRFADYDALSEFYRRCVDHDVSIELEQVHNPVEPDGPARYGLTPDQRETLMTALETGYFAVPRETTLVELSEELGVSDSAVSQRLRRGLASLVSGTLLAEPRGRTPGN